MLLTFVCPGDAIIDVGAHIGTFAITLWKKSQPGGTVIAFEANPKTFELLEHNIAQNSSAIKAVCCGVSDTKGPLYLKDRGTRKETNSGADYLVTEKSGDADLVIELVAIDDVIEGRVDLIKIDVEGMETSVLKSAERTIDKYQPLIYTEYCPYYMERAGLSPKAFQAFFENRNYHFFVNVSERNADHDNFELVRVPGPLYTLGQVDFLMIPSDSERYPTDFKDWKSHAFTKYAFNRLRNLRSNLMPS